MAATADGICRLWLYHVNDCSFRIHPLNIYYEIINWGIFQPKKYTESYLLSYQSFGRIASCTQIWSLLQKILLLQLSIFFSFISSHSIAFHGSIYLSYHEKSSSCSCLQFSGIWVSCLLWKSDVFENYVEKDIKMLLFICILRRHAVN